MNGTKPPSPLPYVHDPFLFMAASPEPDASPLGCPSPLPSPSSPDHLLSTAQSSPADLALPSNASAPEDPSVPIPSVLEDGLDDEELDEYILQSSEVCPPVSSTFLCLTYNGRYPHELRLSLSRTHPRCFLRSPEGRHSSINSSLPPSAERSEAVDK